MQFAPVLPPDIGAEVDKGEYHLTQAFMWDDPNPPERLTFCVPSDTTIETYRRWGECAGHHVILDNGTFELGTPDVERLFQVADLIHPDEIVCPDVIQDADQTILLAKELIKECRRKGTDWPMKVMIVPQGKTVLEWVQCAEKLLEIAFVEAALTTPTIGVPKYLEGYEGGRMAAVAWAAQRVGCQKIHLLGTYRSFYELVLLNQWLPGLRGADSSWPYALACHGIVQGPGNYVGKHKVNAWAPGAAGFSKQLILLTEINVAVCRALLA